MLHAAQTVLLKNNNCNDVFYNPEFGDWNLLFI